MNKTDTTADLELIERRAKGLHDWLEKNGRGCFEEQLHVHAGTKEKIYWHYGYMVALADVLRYLCGDTLATDSTPSHTHSQDKHN
ncbi:MAG TPA: hypothetical protein VK738_06230 [Terriglobales bacterium]|jgi:hypothetical protein|nr:hypothetical protein [Terriglobales bacterium]